MENKGLYARFIPKLFIYKSEHVVARDGPIGIL
jgi:hypothetical protein